MSENQKPILIAVLGVTGAGKTTFIQKATGRRDLKIGHTLESCTQKIEITTFTLDGKKICLIDTPGFDDGRRTDANILEMIAKWLRESYGSGMLLTGVILLQQIDGNRVTGSEIVRTRLFEKLLGPKAYRHVVIGTTMWTNISYAQGMSNLSQRSRAKEYWGNMVLGGAEVVKHDDNQASAHFLIQKLISKRPIVVQMQSELETGDGKLSSTTAGQYLSQDLGRMCSQMMKDLQNERERYQELLREYQQLLAQKNKVDSGIVKPDKIPPWVSAVSAVGSAAAAMVPLAIGVAAGTTACAIM